MMNLYLKCWICSYVLEPASAEAGEREEFVIHCINPIMAVPVNSFSYTIRGRWIIVGWE